MVARNDGGVLSSCFELDVGFHPFAFPVVQPEHHHSTETLYAKGRETSLQSESCISVAHHDAHESIDVLFLLLTLVYAMDVTVRLFGLGRSYWRGGWNMFDIFVVLGTFSTTVAIMTGSTSFVVEQLQKLFLVSIAFKLVQKFNNLNQLFKTALCV